MKKNSLLPWRNLLSCVLILLATITSSTALMAQNISTGLGTTGDGQVDPNWWVTPTGATGAFAKTVASYAPYWQPTPITPIAVSGARWINRTGTITSQTVGDHTYDRLIRVPSGSNALNLSFSIAYDDDIVSVDIVDPTGMTVENLASSVIRSTTPTAYYLSNVITRTYTCPKQGDWILRVKVKFLDEVGAFLLSGSATTTQGACPSNCKANFDYALSSTCGNVTFANASTGTAPLAYSWNFGDPTSTSNTSTLLNPTHQFTACGSYNVCLLVTGPNGCRDSICRRVDITDNVLPIITCPPNRTIACLNDSTVSMNGIATATDNCGTPTLSYTSVAAGNLPCSGTIRRTWTARDACGNTASCVQTITLNDNIPPIVTCPANITVTAPQPDCKIAVSGIGLVTATDNCATPSVIYNVSVATTATGVNNASGTVFNSGTSTVAYSVRDICGNVSNCSFTVTVKCDSITPSVCPCPRGQIAGPNLITNGDFSAGNTGFTSAYGYFAPRRNSPGPGNYTVQNDASTYISNNYWVLRGNTGGLAALDSFMVCDGLDRLTAAYRQTITTTVGRTYQFCVDANNMVRPNSGFFSTAVVELWVKDGSGIFTQIAARTLTETPDVWETISGTWSALNTSAIIEIRGVDDFALDNVKLTTCGAQADPCKADFTFTNINDCGRVQFTNTSTTTSSSPIYSWNFGGLGTSTAISPAFQFTSCGTFDVCLTLTDVNNCTSTICKKVTITSVPPVVTKCPSDTTISCVRDTAASVLGRPIVATNSCTAAFSMVYNDVVTSGSLPCNGVIHRTWNIVDICGNRQVCTQNITVRDNISPVLVGVPANVTVQCSAIPAFPTVTATDNCSPSVSVAFNEARTNGSCPNAYALTRTWSATDDCGNTASASQVITVIDNTPPVIVCPSNRTVACVRDTTPSVTGLATATDNCATSPTVSYTNVTSGSLPCNGTIQRTWTARDACGNTSTCLQLITVRDSVKPTITCPANVTVTGSLPSCRVAVSAIKWLTATDNCGSTPSVNYAISGATTVASGVNDASGQLFNGGTSTVTYTALDNCSNTQTCSFTVTVRCDSASTACPCPNMMVAGPNLVVNGNFSAGNTGFASDYTYYTPATSPSITGGYTVCDSISAYSTNNYWYCTDHTTGSPTGLFLVCDGSASATAAAWRQTFTIAANRIYNLCFYAKNLVRPNSGFTNPSIEVWIKEGTAAFMKKTPLPIVLPETPNNWQLISFNWTSSVSPSPLVIEIRSVVSGSGTDFAIDDISLTTCGTPNSIKETNVLAHMSIVPNPNQGSFIVTLPKVPQNKTKLRVVNVVGQLVQEFDIKLLSEQQTIQLSETVSNGVYFLQMVTESKVLAVEKFVKQ